ncbi:AAA family ATPase (plasmid) [Cytobacillus oceanisediminis]|nr:AAA family ATPase [Cytobacillus oceanisediminis]
MSLQELVKTINEQNKEKAAPTPAVKEPQEDIIEEAKKPFTVPQVIEPVKHEKKKKRKIQPTPSQQTIIKDIKRWYFGSKGYSKYEFGGYAGVGKSTVIEIILEDELKLSPYNVQMCAPTGTAALVLREKTPKFDSMTMHKLFYTKEIVGGRTTWVPTTINIRGCKLIIIDEASMVGRVNAEDVIAMCREAGVKLLIVGDPGQLPPVDKNNEGNTDYFFINPDAMLTEVMRQAADNPIIALSMQIRQATEDGVVYRFPVHDQKIGNNLFIMNKNKISVPQFAKLINNGGAIIAGTHKTRKRYNTLIREELGFDKPTLMDGEKIVIKENTEGGEATNGMRGTVSRVRKNKGLIRFDFTPDAFKGTHTLEVHEDILFERKTMAQMKKENYIRKSKKEPEIPLGVEAWFGYVITGHASQGSQWKTVYAIDEGYVFNRSADGYKTQNRWLYTVVTRASENLVVYR